MYLRSLLTIGCAALVACQESATGPTPARVVVGIIEPGGLVQGALSGPTTGAVGEPLTFRVTTWGSGCYWSAGAAVINQGLQMTVIPYDSVSSGACTEQLRPLARDVVIVFDRSGDAVLRLQGTSLVGRNPAVITWPLQIRP